ncbi:dynein intermediate chain 2, ciliary-like, partial [Penaeus indicus]|uniref:dynein intermediate chain 2, ciliary-like n=1 Tax=Penaeus indicus TaxID=29960 RepID=UPI00300D3AE9
MLLEVRWVPTDPGESLCFYSVSEDGRVSEWLVRPSALVHADILDFIASAQNAKLSKEASKFLLEGRATCIALNPNDKTDMLVGVDTGEVLRLKTSSTHALTRYPAHVGAVRDVAWNAHHCKVFASCSLDWTLKIWIRDCLCSTIPAIVHPRRLIGDIDTVAAQSEPCRIMAMGRRDTLIMSPLVTLDLGSPVGSVSWSPYSSSVVAAATDEGRIYVYDLFLRKCHPLCSQNLNQRRRLGLSCVAFNPFSPVVLVGGEKYFFRGLSLRHFEISYSQTSKNSPLPNNTLRPSPKAASFPSRGYLMTLKLSPNLRRPYKDAKGAEEMRQAEIELCKMERIIATSKEWEKPGDEKRKFSP